MATDRCCGCWTKLATASVDAGLGRPLTDGGDDAGDGAGVSSAGETLVQQILSLARLAVPLFVSWVSFAAMAATNSSLLGHSGTRYLTATSLGDLWTSSTGVFAESYFTSMFCSQAWGAGNKKLVGIWIQVAYVILSCACVVVFIAWCFTGVVLRSLGKPEQMATDATYFAIVLGLCLPGRVAFSQLAVFFSSQGIMRPEATCSTAAMIFNLALGLVFVLGIPIPGWDGFGFHACPWVTTVVQYFQLFLLWYVFCHRMQLHRECWPGWSTSHITQERVVTFLRQYVPMTLSSASDWWRITVIGIIAASFGDINVVVWNTSYRICWISLIFSSSLSEAAGIQLGIALGAGRAAEARRRALLGLSVGIGVVALIACVVVFFPRQCGMIFSSDEAVLQLFADSRVALASFVFFMNLAVVFEVIIISVGLARTVFWIGVVGSWLGQVPGAFVCTQFWRHDLVGLFAGAAAGYAFLCVLFAKTFLTIDWNQLSIDAKLRSEIHESAEDKMCRETAP
eukprot:TRINITY_DN76570_c0_g1_i1.p1 TRINITY_DN76570_c0_g1~~TRINITY_DN76570_c0_g1_i1.p1  ORF type:complete len:522 (-),score=64.78 TRINITY_DN76570_c0_g1_i1:93-1625(-)